MAALRYQIKLNAGETSSLVFPVLDEHGMSVNITGWTGKVTTRGVTG